MAGTFADVDVRQVGLYVGLIASSFALAQFATNFFWGWASDRIGRKPVILNGTLCTAASFLAFGFCKTLWQAVLVQMFMGLFNGNQAVVSTCLGELTDRSNQSQAFAYLPVIYGIGGITGPLLGGLLVNRGFEGYPYLAPNLFAACLLVVDAIVIMLYMEESLEQASELPPLGPRIKNLFAHVWQFTSGARPSYLKRGRSQKDRSHEEASLLTEDDRGSISTSESANGFPTLLRQNSTDSSSKHILNRNTILLLGTYLIFQLSNISYNSLYPIFAQAPPPTGRALSPGEIGLTLAFAGIITIGFQIVLFGKLRDKLGNKAMYRAGLAGFVLAFIFMPFIGYRTAEEASTGSGISMPSGKIALWIELGAALLIKTVATVGGLTSALLLVKSPPASNVPTHQLTNPPLQITNSAPTHSVLGTLNGLAQTLSAAGRAIGPFVSGCLFSISTGIEPKGEALAFGVFGGVAFIGFLLSLGITGSELEAEGWEEDDDEDSNDNDDDDAEEGDAENEDGGGVDPNEGRRETQHNHHPHSRRNTADIEAQTQEGDSHSQKGADKGAT